jgi:hypothetical protein
MPVKPFASLDLPKKSSWTPLGTPWGTANAYEEIVPGVAKISTSSHGGYLISKERADAMPPSLAKCGGTSLRGCDSNDGRRWYEEDEAWAVLHAAFPEELIKEEALTVYIVDLLKGTLANSIGQEFFASPEGQSLERRRNEFLAAHGKDRFVSGAVNSCKEGWELHTLSYDKTKELACTTPRYPRLGLAFSLEDLAEQGATQVVVQNSPSLGAVEGPKHADLSRAQDRAASVKPKISKSI